jgi:hypothetical protein
LRPPDVQSRPRGRQSDSLPSRPGEVQAEERGQDLPVDLGAAGGKRVAGGQRLACAGVAPDFGPVLGPAAFGVCGVICRQDGPVQRLMCQAQPRGPLVVEVGEGPLLQARVLGGPAARMSAAKTAHQFLL